MNHSISFFVGIMTAIAVGLASCKKSTSNVKTLDHIAGIKPVYEACSGSFPLHTSANQAPSHLKTAIAAVPYTVQQGFYDDYKGSIRLVDDFSPKECVGISSEREDALLGCYQMKPDTKNSIEIILRKTTTAKEQYALVRVFGLIYGDLLMHRSVPASDEPLTLAALDSNVVIYKRRMASSFLGELRAHTPERDRGDVEKMLAPLGITPAIFAETESERRWSALAQIPESSLDQFASRVFGEAFHSRFCTAKTFVDACEKFPSTMAQFWPYANDVLGTQNSQRCPELATTQLAGSARASSTFTGYFGTYGKKLAYRRQHGLDNGARVNADIALAYHETKGTQGAQSQGQGFSLGGNNLLSVLVLFMGGVLGGSGNTGFMQNLLGGNQYPMNPQFPTYPQNPVLPNQPIDPNPMPNVPSNPYVPQQNLGSATAEEMAAFNDTNQERVRQGGAALQFDATLLAECRDQAQAMSRLPVTQSNVHNINGAGTSNGENIGYGPTTGAGAAAMWIGSAGHLANIVNASYRSMAVGTYTGTDGSPRWCQRFRQ